MNSQTRKIFPTLFFGDFCFSNVKISLQRSRERNCVRELFLLEQKRNQICFSLLPGGFIAIAVGDGEKLMELPLCSPKPLTLTTSYFHQRTIFSTSPSIKHLRGIFFGLVFSMPLSPEQQYYFSPWKKSMNFSFLSERS